MGFIRRGNYSENSVEGVVGSANNLIKSKIENTVYVDTPAEKSMAFNQLLLGLASKTDLIIEGKCYVGVTANPVQSLTAHGIDIHSGGSFFCMDIPSALAEQCKRELTALEGYEAVTDSDNDFWNDTYPQMYVYIYKISENTNEKIDTSGFAPLKKMPGIPIVVRLVYTDGSEDKRYYDNELTQKDCDDIIGFINVCINENRLMELEVIHRMFNRIYAEFGKGCCVINYDSGTSQEGGYQSYRSGERSRKKVKLYKNEYPEYMLCRDLGVAGVAGVFENILAYFLMKGKKPGKRQNVKWVNMKEE